MLLNEVAQYKCHHAKEQKCDHSFGDFLILSVVVGGRRWGGGSGSSFATIRISPRQAPLLVNWNWAGPFRQRAVVRMIAICSHWCHCCRRWRGSRRHGWEGVYEGSWSWVGVGSCWGDDDATVYTSIKYAKTLEDGLPPMPSWVAHSTFRHYHFHTISYSVVDRLMEMLDSNSVDVLQSKRTLPWLRLVEAPMQWREECSTKCKRIARSRARTSRQVEHSLRHSW